MKTKLKIIIPIIIAVAAVIIAALCINFKPSETVDIDSLMATAQKYLTEQNYEQAIAEFEKAINLDPMNADAYLGLAEAYIAVGDTDKAVEWLEKGIELTGDERLKDKLDSLSESAEAVTTAAETTAETTTETTTVTTTETTISEMEMKADEIKQRAYDEVINQFIGYNYGEPNSTAYYHFKYTYSNNVESHYILIKMTYGSDELFADNGGSSGGNWLTETYIQGDKLSINERQFAGNTYMDCYEYDLWKKTKYNGDGWRPATPFTLPTWYMAQDFVFETCEDNIYVYKHKKYETSMQYGYGYKLYVHMNADEITKVVLERHYENCDTEIISFEKNNNEWIAKEGEITDNINEIKIRSVYNPYVKGLPEGYSESALNINDSEYKEVSQEEWYGFSW